MIDPELLPEFVAEAGEHLDEMEANLIKLETDPENREIINEIFRDVHTIKGSSAYLGLKVTSELAHKLENLLEMVRQGKRSVDSSLIDTLIAAKDRITSLVADIESYQEERSETDDLIEAIQRCSNDSGTSVKKVGPPPQATDVDAHRGDVSSNNVQESGLSFSDEEFTLDLDDIFRNEAHKRNSPAGITEAKKSSSLDSSPAQKIPASPDSLAGDKPAALEIEEPFAETGDEELFAIYLEQLKINLSDIRDLGVQLSVSENRSELLSAINEKIERLKASANYMGYDKLFGLCEDWQAKLETFGERLFLNDAPSCSVLIEEGINTYLDTIQRHFPQLQEIARVPIAGEASEPLACKSPSSQIDDTPSSISKVHGQDDSGGGESSLSQSEQESRPGNAQETGLSFSEEEFTLDLDGIFDTEEKKSSFPAATTDLRKDSSTAPSLTQGASILPGGLSEDTPVGRENEESYEETGDEELFAIYLEQLKINLTEIREFAAQISLAENSSELLSSISEKIERLKASANYMGYDKLFALCEDWQAKLKTFQERFFLNNAPSCGVLIEEGINAYFDAIQRHFPQLEKIAPVPITGEALEPCSNRSPSSPISDVSDQDKLALREESLPPAGNEYEETIDSELFSIFLEQLKDNLYAVQSLGQQLSTNKKPLEIVSALTKKISRIRAAANYMGYERLTALYDGWVGELDAVRKTSSSSADEIDFVKRLKGCIGKYTDKVLKNFPQIDKSEFAAVNETELPAKEQLPSTPLPSLTEAPSLDLSGNTLLVDRTDELFSIDDTAIEDAEDLYGLAELAENKATDKDKDRILIDRLSAALDNALGGAGADESREAPGKLENIGAKMEPEKLKEDSSEIIRDMPEEKSNALPSPEPSEPVQPEAAAILAGSEDTVAAVIEQVERRKEDRRKEDRRGATEGGVDKVLRQSLRIDANKIDELMNQAGELVINRAWFSQLFNELRSLEHHLQNIPELDKKDVKQVKNFSFKFHEAIVALGRVANELQEGVMKVRMLPISQLFNRYPRLIRDLVHDTDKDIQLVLRGADTELDKMIIEEIADPLIHVIRNAVDHGIEPASVRRTAGKSEKGLLKLDAYHEGSHVVIEVTDDGRGINLEAIKSTALKKGLVNRDQLSRMSPKEITELIMRPGFSTAAQVTRTSGRGVGMDVVKKNLENLNGTIEIDSQLGQGTRIRIKIPLTLAVIKALLVKVRGSLFTIPLIAVDETLEVRHQDINSIKGNEVIYLRDSTIPLIRLSTIFNFSNRSARDINEERTFVVIVSAGNSRVGLVVDELRGQEEVVIKPLPDYLRDNKGFSGATILGDGRISLILDIHELVNLTIGRQSREAHRPLTEDI